MTRLAWFLALLITLATLLGFLGDQSWVFELLDHPRPQYTLGLIVLIPALLFKRQWRALILLLPLSINLSLLLPLVPLQAESRADISFTHINLDKDKTEALDYALSQQSDVVVLQELTPPLSERLQSVEGYQLIIEEPLWNTHGSALLVRDGADVVVTSAEIIHLPSTSERPLVTAALRHSDTTIQLLSLHVTRAQNLGTWLGHSAELAAVAEWSQAQQDVGKQVLIIGDFNSTPWSRRMTRFFDDGSLQSGANGQGYHPTWHAALPRFLQIPIDLAAHSDQLDVTFYFTGPSLGGDHTPLNLGIRLR